jgi:hypothetical protein
MGAIVVAERAYSLCPACHRGQVPVDAALGFSAGKPTLAAEQLATLAGTVGSFAEAAERFLPTMAGRRLSESTVARTTAAAGERLGVLWVQGQTLGAAADWRWNRDARGRTVAHVGVDATGVGIPGQRGANADGRMVWVGTVFNPRVAPTQAFPKPHPPRARSQAGLRDRDALGARLRRHAAQVGRERAQQWVALTDGGAGLDDFRDVFVPRAVRILDFHHAAEHLGDLAQADRGGDATAAEDLTARGSHRMNHQGGAAILATLEALDLQGRAAAVREEHRQVTGYARNTLHRRDDPQDRAQGWQIGSGPLEAACKTVVNQRLKPSGMRWGSDGADAVRHRRALYEGESGQWNAFWERSIN